jgi:hypothetical protein
LSFGFKDGWGWRHTECRIIRCGGVLDRYSLRIPSLAGLKPIKVMVC